LIDKGAATPICPVTMRHRTSRRDFTGAMFFQVCGPSAGAGSIPVRLTNFSSALAPGAKYLKNGAVAAVRIELISIERDPVRKEQPLEALLLIEGGLHPEVRGARQNALCERQDARHVDFLDGLGVAVDLGERQVLPKPVPLAPIARQVDRLRVEASAISPMSR
jgi:hypothetical protein